MGADVLEAVSIENGSHRRSLVEAVLQGNESGVPEPGGRLCAQGVNGVEPVEPGGQGATRLPDQIALPEVGICVGNVRRVGDDGVQGPLSDGRQPVTADDPCVSECPGAEVSAGQAGGSHGAVGRDQGPGGALEGQCGGDGAAPAAGIQDPKRCIGAESFKRQFHQELRLRARDQGIRGDLQIQGPECLMAADVGDRFAGETASDQGLEACQLRCAERGLRPGQEPRARVSGRIAQ